MMPLMRGAVVEKQWIEGGEAAQRFSEKSLQRSKNIDVRAQVEAQSREVLESDTGDT